MCRFRLHGKALLDTSIGLYINLLELMRYYALTPAHYIYLSFFSEIGLTQRCRTEIFLPAAHGNYYQNYKCHNIGNHLKYFLCAPGKPRNIEIHPVEYSEEVGAPYCIYRLPGGEYNQRNCQPAETFYGKVIAPGALDIIHCIKHTAEA